MCGSFSAIGLEDHDRELWPYLRERLREPGHLMALMRGVLGDAEVATVVAVEPQGTVKVIAVVASSETIVNEIRLTAPAAGSDGGGSSDDGQGRLWHATIGDYDVEVVTGEWPDGRPRPLAVLVTPWIEQHLLLYARTLWRRR
jgi:hypothetical protein